MLSSTCCVNFYIAFYCLLSGWICIFCCILSHDTSGSCLTPKAFSTEYSHFSHFACILEHRASLAKQFFLFNFYAHGHPSQQEGKQPAVLRAKRRQDQAGTAEPSCLMGPYRVVCSKMRQMPTQFMDSLVVKYGGCQRFFYRLEGDHLQNKEIVNNMGSREL